MGTLQTRRSIFDAGRARTYPTRAPPRAFPRIQQPDIQRAEYFEALRGYVARAEDLLLKRLRRLLPGLPGPGAPRGDARLNSSLVRADAPSDDAVRSLFRDLAKDMLDASPNAAVAEMARAAATGTSNFSRAQLRAAFRSHIGVDLGDVLAEEPGLRGKVDDFTRENVKLIRSVSSRYFEQVEKLVLEGVTAGIRPEKLAEKIQERTRVAESRAALIARDQVGKFYGALNSTRQQKLGVRRYTWRTVRDGRVREEHEDRHGKVFSWDDPPPDGHPGKPINCRCYAEPLVDEVLAGLLEENAEQPARERVARTPAPPRAPVPRARVPRPPPTPRVPVPAPIPTPPPKAPPPRAPTPVPTPTGTISPEQLEAILQRIRERARPTPAQPGVRPPHQSPKLQPLPPPQLPPVAPVPPIPIPFPSLPPPPAVLPRGGSAVVVAQRHPELARALGDKLTVDGYETSPRVREEVRALARLPENLLAAMRERLGDVHISTQTLTFLGRSGASAKLRGVQPRGHAQGVTPDAVAGVYLGASREVLVSTAVPSGCASTSLHEFAHAVDALAAGGRRPVVRKDPTFLRAYEAFRRGTYRYSAHPYFSLPGSGGAEETFAEAFAMFYARGRAEAESHFGPEVTDYIARYYGHDWWKDKTP